MIREATGTPARVFARFGEHTTPHVLYGVHCVSTELGVEKHVELDGLSVSEVEKQVGQLLGS